MSGRLTKWLIQHWMCPTIVRNCFEMKQAHLLSSPNWRGAKTLFLIRQIGAFWVSAAVWKVLLLVPKWKLWGIKWAIHAESLRKGLFQGNGWCVLQAGLIETSVMFIYIHVLRGIMWNLQYWTNTLAIQQESSSQTAIAEKCKFRLQMLACFWERV